MSATAEATEVLVVHTESGDVRGIIDHGVRTWRGIPFAAPPVGDLRFRAPEPAVTWQGVLETDSFSAIPMQKRGYEPIGGAGNTTPISEDCLTINVSAPLSPEAGLRPVVVWIYGGGFSVGGSRNDLFRGDSIVTAGDVIFVSFNYRVGIFGFVDFSSWSTPDRPLESNNGLRDQVAALAWIKRNIAAFGGDPSQVTIVGQSAGGASVMTLMCVPSAAGLFQRVFAISPATSTFFSPERHLGWARELLGSLGVDPDDRGAVGKALTELPADQLIAVASTFFYDVAPDKYPGMLPTSPVIDGTFLPKHPVESFRDGSAERLPLVIGTVAREGAILDKVLTVIPSRVKRIEQMLRNEDPSLRERLGSVYAGFPSHKTAIDMAGDFLFWAPSMHAAEAHARNADCWVYRFDYATPLTRMLFGEATHGADLTMLFGVTGVGMLGMMDTGRKQASKAMSDRFQRAFIDFARGSDPEWARYDATSRSTRIFDTTDREERDPRRERRIAWGDYLGPQ